MNEWNIQSRATACESCQRAFADQETFYTLLFDERQDYRRTDVCASCWQSQHVEARSRKGFISCWQGVYEAPSARPDAIQKETAETLLRKLIELNDPKFIPAAFILAVMLERKRILKVKEQFQRDGHRLFIYEQPRTGDLFTIHDPNLQLNQLEQVQQDVAALLEHGLNPPASGDSAAANSPAGQAPDAASAPAGNTMPAETEPLAATPAAG